MRIAVARCGLQSRDAGCELRDVDCRDAVASRESRDASCDCQMLRDWGILWRTFVTSLS